MKLSQIGEFGLIAALQSGLKRRAGTRLGIGDDCAVLETLHTPIVTLDALVEGVHFRRDWTTPRALGRKAMAVSASDLAASGARPIAAFVSLTLSARDDVEFVRALYQGFEDMAHQFNFTVAGGDTTRTAGDLVLSVTLIGEVISARRGPILRSGAQPGDKLWVSGTLGDAAAGLAILQAESKPNSPSNSDSDFNADAPESPELSSQPVSPTIFPADAQGENDKARAVSPAARAHLLARHHEPAPRLAWMKRLLELDENAVHAALDVSDGLVGDAAHLAKSSGLQLEIDAQTLPISSQCREAAAALGADFLDLALSGGEDYELLLAIAPERATSLMQRARAEGIALTEIGVCQQTLPQAAPVVVRYNGVILRLNQAWTHF